MAANIQLDDDLERMLADTARRLKVSRAEAVRRSIRAYCEQILEDTGVYPWELMKDSVGGFHSGRGDLARNSSKYVKEIIRAKHEKRRRHSG